MKFLLPFILMFSGIGYAQLPSVPAELVMPPSLSSAGTEVVVDGAAWGYVVWQATDPAWYAAHDVAVYLKSGDADSTAPLALQGTMALMRDGATISPWIARAQKLADATGGLAEDLAICQANAGALIKQWSPTPNPTVPAALKDRLAQLGNRAAQEPGAAAALRGLGGSHPIFRFISGTGWAGPLGVPIGQDATFELREISRTTGVEGAVIGRVTLRAVNSADSRSSPDIVVAPGQVIQVRPNWPTVLPAIETTFAIPPPTDLPDLAPALRWSVPEVMRPQILLTRGFMIWRNDSNTSYGTIQALLAASGNLKKILRNPAAADKIFKGTNGIGSGPQVDDFAADRSTFFVADDNGRYDFATQPGDGSLPTITGVAHEADLPKYYQIAAVDLLGRYGPPAASGVGYPIRTLPPQVPSILRVENVISNGNQRLRVTFRPNLNTPDAVNTQRYLVFRDRLKNTSPLEGSLNNSVNPERNNQMIYVGVADQPSNPVANSEVTFIDESLIPVVPGDYGQTYYYCVRAVALREQGIPGMNISSPSPPSFGTVRDREGPPAPTGFVVTERARAGMSFVASGTTADSKVPEKVSRMRMQFERMDSGIASIRVAITSVLPGQATTAAAVRRELPELHFGNGNEISYDYLIGLQNRNSGPTNFEFIPVTSMGRLGKTFEFALNLSDTPERNTQVMSVKVKSGLLLEMAPDTDPFWLLYFIRLDGTPIGQTIVPTTSGDGVFTGQFPGAVNSLKDRSLLIQRRFGSGAWVNLATSVLPRFNSQFIFGTPDTSLVFNAQYRVWEVFDRSDEVPPVSEMHSTGSGNSSQKTPIVVGMNLPVGAFEYRLYRRIDQGPLFMIKQDTGTWDPLVVKVTVVNDGLLPSSGGEIAYFGQTFDQHGNAGPLSLIAKKVYVSPVMPVPVVDAIESGGSAAQPTMMLRASCPSPGVERMEIIMDPPGEATPGTLSVPKSGNAVIINPKPGGIPSGPKAYTTSLYPAKLFANDPNLPAVLDTEIWIKAGVEYTIQIRAIGKDDALGVPSAAQKFTWSFPLVGAAVPWPARPMASPLIWAEQVRAFLPNETNYQIVNPQTGRSRSIADATVFSRPVAVQIGTVPLVDRAPQSASANSNWDVFGVFTEARDAAGFFGIRDLPGFAAANGPDDLLHQFLARKEISQGDISTYDYERKLLPVVLYRQQTHRRVEGVLSAVTDADIAQVSPMIQNIAWAAQPTTVRDGTTFSDYALFVDPYVGVLQRASLPATNASLALCLYDTAPVATGARYRYFLAHFDEAFEIDGVIDAGVVEIPETP